MSELGISAAGAGRQLGIDDLLPELLTGVFAHLDFETRCDVIPLVCKKWHKFTQGPSIMWETVVIEPVITASPRAARPTTRNRAILRWLKSRATSVQELRLRLFDYKNHDFRPGDFVEIFKMVGENLRALHVLKCGEMLAEDGFVSMSVLKRLNTLSIRNWDQENRVDLESLEKLTCLSNLTSLTLEMDIDGFPECLVKLPLLEEIMLQKCRNVVVPPSVSKLTRLKTLAMVECGMQTLSESVCGLKGLEVLNLGMNELGQKEGLPLGLSALSRVKQLGLCCNEYDAVPEIISSLTSLEVLWLSGNRFSMPDEAFQSLGNLWKLCELHLSCCRLTSVPRGVCDLTSLTELNLAGNRLSMLPEGLSNLSRLRELDLHRNNFLVAPPVLARMHSLRRLNLLQNSIVYDKNTVALAYLPELEELNLPGCGDNWTWSRGGWSTRSFRYFAELVCKLSSCTRTTRTQPNPTRSKN
ncbi:hypothetical protein BSKO_11745 [Bryopsis sp. KO-2023]|nr:hypothetical protein BSKO_11745 [Bryopsis sp. KO-2023]